MRPDFGGLKLAPAVPSDWESLEIDKDFRGKHLHIVVNNPNHLESGCKRLTVNGTVLESNYVPEAMMQENTEIILDIS